MAEACGGACGEGEGEGGAAAVRARKRPVAYSEKLAERLCRRLAAGELLAVICRGAGMPTAEAVAKWARARPDFAQALVSARRAGGRAAGARGPVDTYCEELREAVFARLCDGESLTRIGADPSMPSLSTLMRWRRRFPEFEALVALGKEVQAERFCDLGWEMAEAATPETAYLTHVRLGQLRWMAGVMAPRTFRLRPVEPEPPPRRMDVLIRHFEVEVDPETGRRKVVAYCPNPLTGEAEREPDVPER